MKNKSELQTLGTVLVGLAILAIANWTLFVNTMVFVLTLGILVLVHEWGHFIAARAVGVRVFEFAIGMGPRLLTWMRRDNTDYTIRLIPMGGFVNLKGMQPDDPIAHDGANGRRPAERALIYLGGPVMNVVFATLVLCSLTAVFGAPDPSVALVGDVTRKNPAERMEVVSRNGEPVAADFERGLQSGDKILRVNGVEVSGTRTPDGKPQDARLLIFRQVNPYAGRPVTVEVQRGRDTLLLRGTPAAQPQERPRQAVVTAVPAGVQLPLQVGDQIDQIDGMTVFQEEKPPSQVVEELLEQKAGREVKIALWRDGRQFLEITGPAAPVRLETRKTQRTVGVLGFRPTFGVGPREPWGDSISTGIGAVWGVVDALKALFQEPKQLGESVGGPIAIFDMLSKVGKLPLLYYVNFIGGLSLSLALINLLPIPVLDGGHMLLLTVEVLRRKRLEPQTQQAVMVAGFAIVGVLVVLIAFRDVVRQFG